MQGITTQMGTTSRTLHEHIRLPAWEGSDRKHTALPPELPRPSDHRAEANVLPPSTGLDSAYRDCMPSAYLLASFKSCSLGGLRRPGWCRQCIGQSTPAALTSMLIDHQPASDVFSMASAASSPTAKSARLSLRATRERVDLLRRAAEVAQKSLSNFILNNACLAAEQTLLDQRLFMVTGGQYQKLMDLLELPEQSNEGLRDLFSQSPLGYELTVRKPALLDTLAPSTHPSRSRPASVPGRDSCIPSCHSPHVAGCSKVGLTRWNATDAYLSTSFGMTKPKAIAILATDLIEKPLNSVLLLEVGERHKEATLTEAHFITISVMYGTITPVRLQETTLHFAVFGLRGAVAYIAHSDGISPCLALIHDFHCSVSLLGLTSQIAQYRSVRTPCLPCWGRPFRRTCLSLPTTAKLSQPNLYGGVNSSDSSSQSMKGSNLTIFRASSTPPVMLPLKSQVMKNQRMS